MKVRLLVSRIGPGLSQSAGEIIEVSAEEGAFLIGRGKAEPVRSAKPKTEKAVASKVSRETPED